MEKFTPGGLFWAASTCKTTAAITAVRAPQHSLRSSEGRCPRESFTAMMFLYKSEIRNSELLRLGWEQPWNAQESPGDERGEDGNR